jgi:hypothetical protein
VSPSPIKRVLHPGYKFGVRFRWDTPFPVPPGYKARFFKVCRIVLRGTVFVSVFSRASHNFRARRAHPSGAGPQARVTSRASSAPRGEQGRCPLPLDYRAVSVVDCPKPVPSSTNRCRKPSITLPACAFLTGPLSARQCILRRQGAAPGMSFRFWTPCFPRFMMS